MKWRPNLCQPLAAQRSPKSQGPSQCRSTFLIDVRGPRPTLKSVQALTLLSVACWGLWSNTPGTTPLPQRLNALPRHPPWAMMACRVVHAPMPCAMLICLTVLSSANLAMCPAKSAGVGGEGPHNMWPTFSVLCLAWRRFLLRYASQLTSCRKGETQGIYPQLMPEATSIDRVSNIVTAHTHVKIKNECRPNPHLEMAN